MRVVETRGLKGQERWPGLHPSSFRLHPFNFPCVPCATALTCGPSIANYIRLFLNLHNLNNLAGGKNEKP